MNNGPWRREQIGELRAFAFAYGDSTGILIGLDKYLVVINMHGRRVQVAKFEDLLDSNLYNSFFLVG